MLVNLDNKTIGIIGLGDLGSRLANQELLSNNVVLAFDRVINHQFQTELAVDPDIDTALINHDALNLGNTKDIVDGCEIVHWAIAANQLASLPLIPQKCIVVLHDSVMNNSLKALSNRSDKDQFVVAHCLMNNKKRVLISTEFGNFQKVHQHFTAIGLDPKYTTIDEHDRMMARSQGVFALLIDLGIRKELDQSFMAGNLTPSAIELREAVINRESNWTKQTIHSILENPKLEPFVKEMLDLLYRNK